MPPYLPAQSRWPVLSLCARGLPTGPASKAQRRPGLKGEYSPINGALEEWSNRGPLVFSAAGKEAGPVGTLADRLVWRRLCGWLLQPCEVMP